VGKSELDHISVYLDVALQDLYLAFWIEQPLVHPYLVDIMLDVEVRYLFLVDCKLAVLSH
jgi:hypothetical protein